MKRKLVLWGVLLVGALSNTDSPVLAAVTMMMLFTLLCFFSWEDARKNG